MHKSFPMQHRNRIAGYRESIEVELRMDDVQAVWLLHGADAFATDRGSIRIPLPTPLARPLPTQGLFDPNSTSLPTTAGANSQCQRFHLRHAKSRLGGFELDLHHGMWPELTRVNRQPAITE
jgi:hypothetical protein